MQESQEPLFVPIADLFARFPALSESDRGYVQEVLHSRVTARLVTELPKWMPGMCESPHWRPALTELCIDQGLLHADRFMHGGLHSDTLIPPALEEVCRLLWEAAAAALPS